MKKRLTLGRWTAEATFTVDAADRDLVSEVVREVLAKDSTPSFPSLVSEKQ